MRTPVLAFLLVITMTAANAEISGRCSISAGRWDGKTEFSWDKGDCAGERHCHEGNSDMEWTRWTGVSPEDLQHEGAAIDARMATEAGEMRCTGKVHDAALEGTYSFAPNAEFAKHMEAMGFGDQ